MSTYASRYAEQVYNTSTGALMVAGTSLTLMATGTGAPGTGTYVTTYTDRTKGTVASSVGAVTIAAGSMLTFYADAPTSGGVDIYQGGSLLLADVRPVPDGGGKLVIDPRAFGAKWDNATDDTAALQAAINAAAFPQGSFAGNDINSRIVQLPPGHGWTTDDITVPANVQIQGHGIGATYVNRQGSSGTCAFKIATGSVEHVFADFGIIVQQATIGGIDLTGGDFASIMGDQHSVVRDVAIYQGLFAVRLGGTENRLSRVAGYRQWGTAFDVGGTDHFIEGCTAAAFGQANASAPNVVVCAGFNLGTTNSRIYGCKAFGGLNGGGGGGGTNLNVSGFLVAGSGRNQIACCEVQDVQGNAYSLASGDNTLNSCLADSCNGIAWQDSSGNNVLTGCYAINRGGAYTMIGALYSGATSPTTVEGMKTRLVRRVYSGAAQAGIGTCQIDESHGQIAVAYAATITPDPWLGGSVNVGTITGNITIANPQSNPTNGADGTAAWYKIGQELKFVLPVNGTGGYTLAFGTSYKLVGASAPALGANTVVQITFRYDGTNWRETGRSIT